MRTHRTFVLLTLLTACAGPASDEENLVQNGGFEEGSASSAVGWRLEQGGANDVARERGPSGFNLVVDGSQLGIVLLVTEPVPVTGGQTYTFSIDYHQSSGDGFTSGARLELRWLDQARTPIGSAILEGTAVGKWAHLEHSVMAPDGAALAQIAVGRTSQPTTVAIDNVMLYVRR